MEKVEDSMETTAVDGTRQKAVKRFSRIQKSESWANIASWDSYKINLFPDTSSSDYVPPPLGSHLVYLDPNNHPVYTMLTD